MRNRALCTLILATGLPAAGCTDQAGPQAAVSATVTLTSQMAADVPLVALASGEALWSAQRPISLDIIDSLIVVVERVEVVPDSLTAEDWYELAVVGDGRLDLMALPSGEDEGLTIAAGEVPAGDYDHARLFIASAEIWFNATVTTPRGLTFEPGQSYAVIIPSSDQTGIKTDTGFTVPDTGGEIPLLFDAEATVAHVNVTGSGKIMVPPVIRVRG